METRFAASGFFNTLSDDHKKAILENGLGPEILHDGLRFAIPIWWLFQDQAAHTACEMALPFLSTMGTVFWLLPLVMSSANIAEQKG